MNNSPGVISSMLASIFALTRSMSKLADCVIGMGANLGTRAGTLRSAVVELAKLCSQMRVSSLYETRPVGPPQPDYLNAAVRIECSLPPSELLQELLVIERSHGRIRTVRWGARTLDLDILWIAHTRIETASLTVPHPGLTARAFAILPLLDVAPEAADPMTGVPYRTLLAALDRSGVRRVRDSEWAD